MCPNTNIKTNLLALFHDIDEILLTLEARLIKQKVENNLITVTYKTSNKQVTMKQIKNKNRRKHDYEFPPNDSSNLQSLV